MSGRLPVATAFRLPPRHEQQGERATTYRPLPCHEKREQSRYLPAAASCRRRAASSKEEHAAAAFRPSPCCEEGGQRCCLAATAVPHGAPRREQ